MNKYAPLENHLESKGNSHIPMTFSEIESVINDDLPLSARKHRAWWSNNPSNSVITYAWLSAGYKTSQVDMGGEKLVFQRNKPNARTPPKNSRGHPIFGAMRGTVTVAPGVDLTAPTGVQWDAKTI